MTDRIEVDYVQLQQIRKLLQARADDLEGQYHTLVGKGHDLRDVWHGNAADKFFNEISDLILPALRRLIEALDKTQNALSLVSALLQNAEAQAGNLFKSTGATGEFKIIGGGSGLDSNTGVQNERGGNNPLKTPNSFENFNMRDFPHIYQNMLQMNYLEMYKRGNIKFSDLLYMLKEASQDPFKRNFVQFEAILGEHNLVDVSFNPFYKDFQGDNYQARISGPNAELEANLRAKFDKNGINIGGDVNAGIYAIRAQGTAEMNGIKAMGDAYVGINGNGEAGFYFDPTKAGFKAEGELFAGGKAQASVRIGNDVFNVNLYGSASYGVGASGVIDVGIDNGIFRFELGGSLTKGLGLGAGAKVEVNLPELVNSLSSTDEFVREAAEKIQEAQSHVETVMRVQQQIVSTLYDVLF